MIEEINEADLQNIIVNNKIVIVDYSATWCGPCQFQHIILQKLEEKYGDKIKIVTMDIDKNMHYATKLNIFAVPTLQIYHNGKLYKHSEDSYEEDRFIGVQQENILSKICDNLFNSGDEAI
ncbi:MAG: thioredoxin family protein [Candidatus Helarchaeota archaeon]